MSSDPLPLVLNMSIIIVLVLLNGFFVSAEFALVRMRNGGLEALVSEGNSVSRFLQSISSHINAYLSACQIGITMASLALGWVGGTVIAGMLEPMWSVMGIGEAYRRPLAFVLAFTIIAVLHITFGEQVPKAYAIRKSEAVTARAAAPLFLFYKLMAPFIWVLNGMSQWLLRKTGLGGKGYDLAHTEEEIRIMMKKSHESGYIDQTELALVDNIFEFSETLAREIMIPRMDMECLYAQLSFAENKELALKDMRTRYPVCDPDKDNVIGFVHIKDLLKPCPEPDKAELRSMIRPMIKVPESIPISQLLKMMQKRKVQMALLIDEYGGTAGLVTLEDILEEIVGDIHDEFDQEKRPSIEKRDDMTYSIDARMLIEEVNDYFELDIDTSDYDTIGGWMYAQIEIPARKNQAVSYNDEYEFIIEETEHIRISRVLVRKLSMQPQSA